MKIYLLLDCNADVYFGVSKSISEDTLKKQQKANETLLKNGVYKKIDEKWAK